MQAYNYEIFTLCQ